MTRKRKTYQLADEDTRVFEAGALNVNNFTDFYLRTQDSGTLYYREQLQQKVKKRWLQYGYDPSQFRRYPRILAAWHEAGEPEDTWFWNGGEWHTLWDVGGNPQFLHHHGFRFIPWQTTVFHSAARLRVIAGGYSSGKSLGMVISALVLAATIPHFKAMMMAPSFFQAELLYKMALQAMLNTPYEDKFLAAAVSKPFPTIFISNSHVSESTLEFRSAHDNGESVLSWRGDWAMIDQAEGIGNIHELRKNVGSRLVGKAPGGRPYMGVMNWVANAGPNPQFWKLYALGKERPEECLAMTVTAYQNPHNSPRDLRRLEREIGGTQEDIDQWMLAKKPVSEGTHFSIATIEGCRGDYLTNMMEDGLRRKLPGFLKREDNNGIYQWLLPYEHGHSYLVIGDPGQANRPDRNAPVIGVFDITDWPKSPAQLWGFHWMDGNASYTPFLSEFVRLTNRYKAQGQCAFDSTGTQKALDELALEFHNVLVEGMNFSRMKFMMLNSLKALLENQMFRYPYIAGIWHQLSNYKLPDTKIPQDIVAMLMMAAHWLRERMGPLDDDADEEDYSESSPMDTRYGGSRYHRSGRW